MAFQAVPNAALLQIHATLDGEKCITDLGFGLASPATVTGLMLEALVNGFVSGGFKDDWLATLPVKYILNQVSSRVLDVQDGPQFEVSIADEPGERAGNILPNNCSLAVAFKTGLSGRTNRGRIYWPSFLEGDVVDQRVTALMIANIVGMLSTYIGVSGVAAGWVWSVISRKIIDGSGNGRAVPITSVVTNDDVIDSMRRRLPKRGQ